MAAKLTSDLLSSREVSAITGFSMQKIQNLIRTGKLAAINTSAGDVKPRWRIRLCDLESYFTPQGKQAAEPKQSKRKRIDAGVAKVFG